VRSPTPLTLPVLPSGLLLAGLQLTATNIAQKKAKHSNSNGRLFMSRSLVYKKAYV
jgi:hypothetical protein